MGSLLDTHQTIELIKPIEMRYRAVDRVVRVIAPDLNVHTMHIYDMYGPTHTEHLHANYECPIVN